MKKSFLPLVVSAGLLGSILMPQSSYALTETQKIEQALNQLKKQKAQVQQEIQKESSDRETLEKQIEAENLKLNEYNEQISSLKASLREIGKSLDEAEARVTSRDQLLKSRLRLMYMNGVVSYADVLLSSTNFGDFLDRLEALKSIVGRDKEILEANKHDRQVIADNKIEKDKQLAETNELYAQKGAVIASLAAKEKEKEVKIASLNKKETEIDAATDEEEKQMIQAARREAEKQRAEQAKAAASGNKGGSSSPPAYTYSGGRFGYPLPRVVQMSSDFGVRVDPVTGRKGVQHNGIDLPSPNGTDILAAESGVVIVANWWSGYGNTVIIDHGKGVWTLYGHIRNDGIVVEKGDVVKRGQKIAEVGSTGNSTGNHLHFEVRINEVPTDPKPYLR